MGVRVIVMQRVTRLAGSSLASSMLMMFLVVSLVCIWIWETFEDRGFYGQDAAVYTMLGARFAAGDRASLWNGAAAPGIPLLIGIVIVAGASVPMAFHVVAFLGYFALIGAVGFFCFRVSESHGCPRSWAVAGGALAAWLFGLATDVLLYGITPLTDQMALATLLTATGLLGQHTNGIRTSAAIGVLAAVSYLFRFIQLPMSLVVIASALASHASARRRTPQRAEAFWKHGSALLLPLTLTVGIVSLNLSGRGYGFSYGANTQVAANAVVERQCADRGTAFFTELNDDGTLGAFHVDLAIDNAWNYYHWLAVRYANVSIRETILEKLRCPHLLSRILRHFGAAGEIHSTYTVYAGACFWLFLLARSFKPFTAHMWVATLLSITTFAGGAVTYFGETRYLWLPIVFCLTPFPTVIWLAVKSHKETTRPLLKSASFAVAALASALVVIWTVNVIVGIGRKGSVRSLVARTRGEGDALNFGIGRLILPLREEAERLPRGLPFSHPTVSSREAGLTLETGGRWLYLPNLLPNLRVSKEEAVRQTREESLQRIFAAFRRGRVGYILLTFEDWADNPAIRPLFGPIQSLPAEVRLLGEIGHPNPHAPARARLLRFLDNG